ncbi:MAG: beta-ketoacyl-[acyl-carrier-protein] synthase family protein [Rhodobacteraceae bacterium]|nr:beta-ketoacyl-[acyl-carrier-protein] synthase family protein [Paracoccaceae bacterium]
MTRRVVVTGMGVVSALGLGRARAFEALREGECGIGQLTRIDASRLSFQIGAEASGFEGEDHFSRQELSLLDRGSQMALVAGREAMAASGFSPDDAMQLRTAVVIGSAMGGMNTLDDGYRQLYGEGKARLHPLTVPRLMPNAPASHLSIAFGLKGPAWAVTTACASSNHAMGQAFHMIRSGAVDAALTGGAESQLTLGVLKAWEGLRVMSRDGCRPFSKTRNGMVQGEGAAIFVFEEMEQAQARGATIWGEVVGFGASADASDIVQPNEDGAKRAIRAALEDGGLRPDQIDYVNAHGTATAANDRTEAAAIHAVFGAHAEQLSVSSTKSMHGHCIGAAGAIELVATLMALSEGVIPPTINYDAPDPECALDVTPNEARERSVGAALSNSFAFGGLNAVLALRAYR